MSVLGVFALGLVVVSVICEMRRNSMIGSSNSSRRSVNFVFLMRKGSHNILQPFRAGAVKLSVQEPMQLGDKRETP